MTRIILVEAVHARDPDDLFEEASDMAGLQHAMAGLARYSGLPRRRIAEGDVFDVTITIWGWLRVRDHHIRVQRLDRAARILESTESNPRVRRWDHHLGIEPHPDGAAWRDRITLETWPGEWLTAQFCRHVYEYRHRHRQALSIRSQITRVRG